MFAHKVIEDLKKCNYIKSDGIATIIKWIEEAQKFHFGSSYEIIEPFKKWVGKKRLFVDDAEFIKMPYNKLWFDYSGKEKGGNENIIVRRGILVECQDGLNFVCLSFAAVNDYKWRLDPHVMYVNINKQINIFEQNIRIGSLYESPPGAEESDDLYISATLSILQSSIMLLNCKNIETEVRHPSEELNKSRRKKGKQELFTYKTLKLLVPGKKEKRIQRNEPTGEHNRIHFCRGHFKEYTAEAPLFGRITGLWWWQPHVRGKSTDGVVMKDYQVEVAP